jgi:hypothetical protein
MANLTQLLSNLTTSPAAAAIVAVLVTVVFTLGIIEAMTKTMPLLVGLLLLAGFYWVMAMFGRRLLTQWKALRDSE